MKKMWLKNFGLNFYFSHKKSPPPPKSIKIDVIPRAASIVSFLVVDGLVARTETSIYINYLKKSTTKN